MRRAALLTLGLALLAATTLPAQWTQGRPGRVWAKSALFVQRTDERFNPNGDRQSFLDGESDARAVVTDVIVGITPRLDLWLQAPWFDLRFRRFIGDTLRTTGFGDVRLWARYQVARLADGRLPVAARVGAKAPLGSSPLDAEIIPVGEGQWDLEAFAEAGYSFWPAPFYALLWVGYRARLENEEKKKDPGREWVLLTEAGVTPGDRLFLKTTLDGFVGRGWVIEGLEVPGAARRLLTLQLGGGVRPLGPVWLEVAARLPLAGRNFIAGTQWVVALSSQLGR